MVEPEVLRRVGVSGGFRAALFDFDGTLSLLRRNWQDVMIPMMVEILAATPRAESEPELRACVEDFVFRLTGRQTIYQMFQLAEEVTKRGGVPREPLEYKHAYHERLYGDVGARVAAVRSGRVAREPMTVPGSHALLERLTAAGVTLYLASGTDLNYVRDEVAVLGFESFFGPRVYGALDDYKQFSKALVVERILDEMHLRGEQLLGFGDGYVEIQEVRKVGGYAVGVASDEERRTGVNAWKRGRLIDAGADLIVGDYSSLPALWSCLGFATDA